MAGVMKTKPYARSTSSWTISLFSATIPVTVTYTVNIGFTFGVPNPGMFSWLGL